MTTAREAVHEFFTTWLPAQFATVKEKLTGRSSPGAMVFRIGPDGSDWTLRLSDGELEITQGAIPDPLLQVSLTPDDFTHLLARAMRMQETEPVKLETQLLAFKALTVDPERAKSVRAVRGNVAFVITDGDVKRRIIITPGDATPRLDDPECRLECQMVDFLEMQAGRQLPIQLAMSGKIRIVGNAAIPMALNAVLA